MADHPLDSGRYDHYADEMLDDSECAYCGGEGFTLGCSWDWQCDTWDAGEGTCLCERRCVWCAPTTPTPRTSKGDK